MTHNEQLKIIETQEQIKSRLNKEWRDESIKFEMGEEHLSLRECYKRAIEQSTEVYKKNREVALESIPEGKYILYVNETWTGMMGHPDIPYIDEDRLEMMYIEETGSKTIDHIKFQERNMRYCLGIEENENRVRTWNAFHEDAPSDLSDCIGIIFSGSEADIKDEINEERLDMTKKVQKFSHIAKEQSIPMLGICFGGQMLSHEEGAGVDFVRDNDGNKITISGLKRILKTEAGKNVDWLADIPDEFETAENHKQEILQGGNGEVLMQNEKGRIEMIFYPESDKVCVQFHPEVGYTRLDIVDSILNHKRNISERTKIWKSRALLIRATIFPIFLRECAKKNAKSVDY